MKHTLDHSTATEAAGGIWELCTTCEAWIRHSDPRDGCEGRHDTLSLWWIEPLIISSTAWLIGFITAVAVGACR